MIPILFDKVKLLSTIVTLFLFYQKIVLILETNSVHIEVRFASFLSGGFLNAIRKLAKSTSVQWSVSDMKRN